MDDDLVEGIRRVDLDAADAIRLSTVSITLCTVSSLHSCLFALFSEKEWALHDLVSYSFLGQMAYETYLTQALFQ